MIEISVNGIIEALIPATLAEAEGVKAYITKHAAGPVPACNLARIYLSYARKGIDLLRPINSAVGEIEAAIAEAESAAE